MKTVLPGLAACLLGVSIAGCATAVSKEDFVRLTVASRGGRLLLSKRPFAGERAYQTGTKDAYISIDVVDAGNLGMDKVEAITLEIEDAARAFRAGYRSRRDGHDRRGSWPNAPAEATHPETWERAFRQGWWFAADRDR